MKKILLFLLICAFVSLNGETKYPKRELRGVWIATVANIDWPIDRTSSSGEKISELVDMFEKLDSAGINAVFFQIRTECDALYESNIEPWSYWLTGEQGKVPEPFFDPLEFAIDEAHKRGMELHAWFNPYRAVADTANYKNSPGHVTQKHPDWILKFGSLQILDPGNPEVKKYILDVVSDVLTRYDIDGIHFDDYFYPYTPTTNEDSVTFAKYGGDFSDIGDWRRNNINSLMADIYKVINEEKPYVKFGISPFAIVENKYAGTNGFESYNILYCDPLNWIENKIVDYINPQIYFELNHNAAAYTKLLPWWAEVSDSIDLYIGQFSSRMAAENYKGSKSELGDQLRLNRATPNVDGEVFFSAKSITQNYSGLLDSMSSDWYKYPALPPVLAWKDTIPPSAPKNLTAVKDSNGVIELSWNNESTGGETKYFVVYKIDGRNPDLNNPQNILDIIPSSRTSYIIKNTESGTNSKYVVTALDRLKNESLPSNTAKVEEKR